MRIRVFYILAIATLVLDQAIKHFATSYLSYGTSVPVIGGTLFLTLVHNQGGAFGLFQARVPLLVLAAVIAAAVIIVLAHRNVSKSKLLVIALAMQLGGAAGNLVDRIRLGYVVDFVDFRIWPVFNVADAAITVGVLLLAYHVLIGERTKETALQTASESTPGE